MTSPIRTLPLQRIEAGTRSTIQDLVAVEEPLEISVNGKPLSITMRTPGHDLELAAGFLFTEGLLESRHAIASIEHKGNNVRIVLQPDVDIDLTRFERHFYMTSSCGVCGKASIEALRAANCPTIPRGSPRIEAAVISKLPALLRQQQTVFEHTGGLHAAALFDTAGHLLSLREDVGRHNAVDKIAGAEMLAGRTPCADRILLVSGRASFELMQKSLMSGIPILAAVGAPSSLAVEVAQRFGLTLLGFVRDGRYNIYAGADRIQ